jgi:anti-anti-sigma factor
MVLAEGPPGSARPSASASLTTRGADCTVVWVCGEHDMSTVEPLSATIARAIDLDADVVLDLSGVEFTAAATVSVILRTQELSRPRSRSLTVRSPSGCARRVLELCGVTDLIDVGGVEVVTTTRPADALGSWVEVLSMDRVDRRGDAFAPLPADGSALIRMGHSARIGTLLSAVADQPDLVCVTSIAGGEGP